jgi:hypothetical protein
VNRLRITSSVGILVLFLLMLITSIGVIPALAQAGIVSPLSLKGMYGHNVSLNSPLPNSSYLASAAVVSANDIWAVGSFINTSTLETTLIEHWNGTRWSVVPSPNPGQYNYSLLTKVAVVSTNDVWAVGFSYNSVNFYQTLTEHWNGSAWSIISSQNPTSDSLFSGVAVVSTNNVWAVGFFNDSSGVLQTLIEHWNGSAWSVSRSPNRGAFNNTLGGVAVNSTGNVWAVGSYLNNSGVYQTLIERWNGTKWSLVNSPNNGSANNILYSVGVISATNVWAVGYNLSSGVQQTLTEHWNGTKWSLVKSAQVGSSENELFVDMAAIATNDVWAMGWYVNNSGVQQTLTEHWNGTKWSLVSSPNVGSSNNIFYGGAAVSTKNVWVVGYSTDSSGVLQKLTEQWNGTKWSVVPSA